MTLLAYLKLMAESIIAIPKIMAEMRDAYIYMADLKDESWLNDRQAERKLIDTNIQDELKKRKPDVQKLADLHRSRYRM